jgi:hypothetical protein
LWTRTNTTSTAGAGAKSVLLKRCSTAIENHGAICSAAKVWRGDPVKRSAASR